jgi:autotransporter-associated beta strand protein
LQLGASITNLNRSITLNSGGGTIDTGSNNLTETGNVSGQGALVKLGSGTLLLNGTSSYSGGTTVSAGTLRGTTTSLQGDIVNNATVTFAQVNDGVYSGVMSGTGVFSKLSNGNLTLTGNSTYTGATTVTAGTLTVNGGLQSAVTVGTGGTLAGNGTLGRSVDVSGKLSAGDGANPMGTLQIVGSLNMGSNSTLVVHAAPDGTNSKVVVGGAVTLNNGNVSVIGNNAEFLPSTQYTILTAQGGVTGTFNTPSTDTAFLVPTLTYDTKDVFLTLARNDTSLQSVAQTRSQVKAATYLQNLGDDAGAAPVVDRVLMLSAKNAPSAFASISGNALANLGHISQKLTGRLMDSLANRLGDAGDGSDPFEYAPAELGLDALPTSDGGFLRESSLTRGLWVRNFNQQGGIKSDGNGAASDWLGGGTALGFDLPLSSQTVVGASYLNSLDRVQLDSGRTGVARISTPQFVAYMSHASGGDSFLGWQVRGLAGYSHPTISSSRAVVIGNDTTVATSTHSAQEISAAGEADLSQNFASFGLHEIVGLRSSRMDEAAYMESGSAAALQIAARVNQSLVSSMGTHLVVPMSFGSSLFDVRAMWRHELRDVGTGSSARLANSTSDSRFYTDGTPMGRDSMTVGANYSARLGRNLDLYGDYSLDVSKESGAQHNLLAGFRYLW